MKIALSELAKLVEGELEGAPEFCVEGIAPVESAGPSQATYIAALPKLKLLEGCKAGCVIVPSQAKGAALPYKGNKIYVKDPQWAFVIILRQLQLEKKPKTPWGIHPTAVVSPSAKIGKYAAVGAHCVIESDAVVGDFSIVSPQCYIGSSAQIGKNCFRYPQVCVREDCVIGDKAILHPGVVIGSDGFGYAQRNNRHEKIPQLGRVVVENDVEIGANTTIDRATLGETRIGEGTKIDNLVQIAHNVTIGKHCIIIAQTGIAGSSVIGNGVVLAGQSGIADHAKIGDGVVLAAQSGAMGTIAPKTILFGSPAQPHMEAMKQQVLIRKLPEIYEVVKKLRKKFPEEFSK